MEDLCIVGMINMGKNAQELAVDVFDHCREVRREVVA